MIRVPSATDHVGHFGFGAYFSDHWMSVYRREKAVYVDGAKPLGQGDVRFRREVLVADDNHAV